MRKNALLACAFAVLLSCTSAYADGAAEAVSYTWTGLYGGINAGWGWQNSDWDFNGGGSNSHEDNSGVVGLQVGYDAQIGNNLFLGLEGSLDAANIDAQSACFGSLSCRTRLDGFGDVSARLGVVNGPALLYVKGGYAYESTSHYVGNTRTDDSADGYLIGAGAEYALMYNLTTKLEYNYMDFGSNDFTTGGTRYSAKENLNIVKLGFNFKFD